MDNLKYAYKMKSQLAMISTLKNDLKETMIELLRNYCKDCKVQEQCRDNDFTKLCVLIIDRKPECIKKDV